MTDDFDERIRAALHARADGLTDRDLTPATAPTGRAIHRRARWLAPVLAASAAAAIAAGTTAIVSTADASHRPAAPNPSSTTVVTTPLAPTSSAPSSTTQAPAPTPSGLPKPEPKPTSRPASRTVTTPPPSSTHPRVTGSSSSRGGQAACYFVEFACPVPSNYVYLQPLWPFADYGAAKQWEQTAGPAGAQPWHLDAGQTALQFTRSYLGFTDITLVTSSSITGNNAQQGVGFVRPDGTHATAAVVHLVRYSSDPADRHAGWEVVGATASDLSVSAPAAGGTVKSPLTVRGRITGVDENVVVSVRALTGATTTAPGVPAGGSNSPWSTSVRLTGSGALSVVASTGGHVQQHERFTVVGVDF